MGAEELEKGGGKRDWGEKREQLYGEENVKCAIY